MKNYLLFIVFLAFLPLYSISSTVSGGDWADTLTWVGHNIPGETDNVIINGPVYLTHTKSASSVTINTTGGIRNGSGYYGTLKVYGTLINNGYIESHPSSYYLSLYTYGDITNNGDFSIYYHYIEGTGSRKFYNSQAAPFQVVSENRINASVDTIFAESDLYFSGGKLLGVNSAAELMLTSPTNGANYDIHLDNTDLSTIIVYGASTNSVYGNLNEYYSTILYDMNLYGEYDIMNSEFHNVVNYGTLQNTSSYYYSLNLYGNFINNGIIRNHPSGYTLTVNCYGNFTNNGTVNPSRFDFFGSSPQTIEFGQGHEMKAAVVIDQDVNSSIISNSDLYFEDNTYIDFNYAQLDLTASNADLYLINSEIRDADIQSTITTEIHSDNDTKIYNSSFSDASLYGVLNFNSITHFYGDIINHGTIQNIDYSHDLHFHGDLENNGVVRNNQNGYVLTTYLYGDITNNGEISNFRIYTSGTDSQDITSSLNSLWSTDYFYDSVDSSSIVLQSDLFLDHTLTDLNYSDLDLNGYKLTCNGGQLRDLQIIGGSNSTLKMDSTAFVQTMTADDLITEGTILVASAVTVDNLVNNGYLYNYGSNSYLFVVTGSIENNGTIGTNPAGYSLTLDHYGNLENNGVFNLYTYNLRGTSDQEIYSAEGTVLEPDYVYDRVAASAVIMTSDLIFDDTYIDLNYSTLNMSNSSGSDFFSFSAKWILS